MEKIRTVENLLGKALETATDDSYNRSGFGTVFYTECPCCGVVDFDHASLEPEDKLVVKIQTAETPERCAPCNFMLTRHPEIFGWANRMVQKQINAAHEASKKQIAEAIIEALHKRGIQDASFSET